MALLFALPDICVFAITVGICVYIYLTLQLKYFKKQGIITLPAYPVVGSLGPVLFRKISFSEHIGYLYNLLGEHRFGGLFEFLNPVLMVKDPELIKLVTVKDFDHFVDRHKPITEECDDMFGKSVFALEGARWRHMRATLSPAFTASKMRTMFLLVNECGRQLSSFLVRRCRDHEAKTGKMLAVEMKDLWSRYANDVIATAGFGVQVDSLRDPENEVFAVGKTLTDFGGVQALIFVGYTLSNKLMKLLHVPLMPFKVKRFMRDLVEQAITVREREDIARPDLIQLLMQRRRPSEASSRGERCHGASRGPSHGPSQRPSHGASHGPSHGASQGSSHGPAYGPTHGPSHGASQGSSHGPSRGPTYGPSHGSSHGPSTRKHKDGAPELNNEDIAAQVMVFFLAGFETTSTLLSFMSNRLAVLPAIQERLREEVDATLHRHGGRVTYEAVHEMEYLDMVISETLRMYPPVEILDRKCVRRYVIPATKRSPQAVLEPGDAVWVPVYGLHRDPKHWPEPDKYDPERFNAENKVFIKPFTFLPFGAGPRNCIGTRFAMMEVKVAVIHLLSRFVLRVVERTPVELRLSTNTFNITVDGGFWLGIEPRKDAFTNATL